MTCAECQDFGIIVLEYENGDPDAYALCLCKAGQAWRNDRNNGRQVAPLWHVWAAKMGVAHDDVVRVEDAFSAQQIAAWYPRVGRATDGLLEAAGRTRKH